LLLIFILFFFILVSAEVLFLIFGIYLCYRVRAAPSEYREGIYISAAICYECFISTIFYVLRLVCMFYCIPFVLVFMKEYC